MAPAGSMTDIAEQLRRIADSLEKICAVTEWNQEQTRKLYRTDQSGYGAMTLDEALGREAAQTQRPDLRVVPPKEPG